MPSMNFEIPRRLNQLERSLRLQKGKTIGERRVSICRNIPQRFEQLEASRMRAVVLWYNVAKTPNATLPHPATDNSSRVEGQAAIDGPVSRSLTAGLTGLSEVCVADALLCSFDVLHRENDPFNYLLLPTPPGVTIVETTGRISWTPEADQIGQQDFLKQARDGAGNASSQISTVLTSLDTLGLPP